MNRPLIVTDELRDLIRHLPPELKKKVKQALAEISVNPASGKALQEELAGFYSYRLGKIRIVYRLKSSSIELVAIGPRRTIYQKVALEIKHRVGGFAMGNGVH